MLVLMRLHKFSERLPFQAPLCPDNLFGHLIATAVPGVEEWREGVYRRTLRLPFGCGIASLQLFDSYVACTVELSDPRDLASALELCRFLPDLDTDLHRSLLAAAASAGARNLTALASGGWPRAVAAERVGRVSPEEHTARGDAA